MDIGVWHGHTRGVAWTFKGCGMDIQGVWHGHTRGVTWT